MSNARERLIKCFCAVFPDLPKPMSCAAPRSRASSASLGTWDSLATATLLGVVEEEFGIDVGDFDALHSFASLLAYL